ncbi:hypothetical protein TIFTF001_052447 [Ficus carica]|uniref:Uncharacterized protein n=1 Tax=Ficus carica TaxID=3494 RepID=A0AA88EPG9_FICCA|nr:hypothetical protein TIFTF001_052447 [Ficus carica]
MKAKFLFPVYTIGPSIPYFQLDQTSSASHNNNLPDYFKWLDSQPKESVLYVSFGSFLSVSSAQLDEIVAGLKNSGTRYLWVARGDTSKIVQEYGNWGDFGIVVPWCDQLRVLCHASVGGFWTHCGWNSTLEAVFGGVPILTFPIIWDQVSNSKLIVEDWKIGYRVKKGIGVDNLVTRDEIAELVKRFMDPKNKEGKLMRERVKELQEVCHETIVKGGSSDTNLYAFIRDISQGHDKFFGQGSLN